MKTNPDFEKINMSEKTASSRAELIAMKFPDKAKAKNIDLVSLTTDDAAREAIKQSRLLVGLGITDESEVNKFIDEIIQSLRAMRLVPTLEEVKAKQKALEKEMRQKAEAEIKPEEIYIETGLGLREVQDESLVSNALLAKKIIEEDEIKKEQRKEQRLVTESDEVVNEIYEQVVTFQEGRDLETDAYYHQFSAVGYSEEEIKADIASLHEREEDFARTESESKKKSKKIATLTEVALERGVSEAKWYGDRVKIQPTSKFDDIKRGIDGVLEIMEEGNDSKFLGLGIDVTFGGEDSYQLKKQKLLSDIQRGHTSKIKYFKDHKGVPQKEFTVPKIILSFSIGDVRKLGSSLRNINTQEGKEEFRNDPIKDKILRQIMEQCEHFSNFARGHNNLIYKQYDAIKEAIQNLGEDYPEVREALKMAA